MGGTYTAEEMADETYEDAARSNFVVGVEGFESVGFVICVKHGEVCDFFEGGFCGGVVVDFDIAYEVGLRVDGHVAVHEAGRCVVAVEIEYQPEYEEDVGE